MPARRPYQQRYGYDADDGATANGGRLVAVLLALAVAALTITQALWQVTEPSPAQRILRSVLPPLTDLDQTLAANEDPLREIAGGQPPDGRVTVPGLPIPVQVTREEVEGDAAGLRAVVLGRMAEAVYQQGTAAFRAPDGTAPTPTILTSQWALRRALTVLTASRHDALRLPRIVAVVATLALGLLAIWLFEGPARLTGPGVSVVAGSVIGGATALAIRAVALIFYGEDEVADAIVRGIAADISTTMLYVALTFFAFGAIVTALGVLAGRIDQAQGRG